MRVLEGLLLALCTFALAGCTGATGKLPGDAPSVTAPPGVPDPVAYHLDETQRLEPGFDRTWSWTVAPSHTSFEVRACLSGPGDSPSWAGTGIRVELDGPGEQDAALNGAVRADGDRCVGDVRSDGSNTAVVGTWRLRITADGPVAADYEVWVDVAYGNAEDAEPQA